MLNETELLLYYDSERYQKISTQYKTLESNHVYSSLYYITTHTARRKATEMT
jgi:hypothetical protein